METTRIKKNVNDIIALIECFRSFFTSKDFSEQKCKTLISKHDSTLRFTNSTTSVLKPYLLGKEPIIDMLLIQPAMGLQGINEWSEKRYLGGYSSYFYSLGTLSNYNNMQRNFIVMMDFLKEIVPNYSENICISAYVKDKEFINLIKDNGCFEFTYLGEEYSQYVHSYGNEKLSGRNINILIKNGKKRQEVGTFSIIEKDYIPVAVEISFDSPLLLCAINKLQHPILTLPTIGMLSAKEIYSDKELEFCDSLCLCIALMIDGLKVQSRGRGGNLKKIIKVYKELFAELGFEKDRSYIEAIEMIIDSEIKIREHCNCEVDIQGGNLQKTEIITKILV